jgi:flagellar hook-associated protein 3 FlgL
MRITDNMRFSSVQQTLGQLRTRQADLTNQISTGRRINAPSDDPVAAARLTRLNAKAARTADYQSTIATVRADISLGESTLAQASQLMVHAHELAVQGANGALTAEDRATMAAEVSALQEQLVSSANTRGIRGYLFSGSQTSTPAMTSAGVAQGDGAEHEVEISPGVRTRVSVTGSRAFSAEDGGTDAFAALETLRQGLINNDTAQITSSLDIIEKSRSQIVRVQAESGLILNRLDSADEALAISALETQKQTSDVADVDPFAAISELTQLNTSLEQAIAIARTTLNRDGSGLF